MPRFYSPNADFSLKKFILADAEELHHLKNVLRIKKGEKIVLFNGKNDVMPHVKQGKNLIEQALCLPCRQTG